MSGYYPAGVSGFEYAISGGRQYDSVRAEACYNEECKMFEVEDIEAEVEVEYSHGMEYYEWKCPTCGATRDIEQNME